MGKRYSQRRRQREAGASASRADHPDLARVARPFRTLLSSSHNAARSCNRSIDRAYDDYLEARISLEDFWTRKSELCESENRPVFCIQLRIRLNNVDYLKPLFQTARSIASC